MSDRWWTCTHDDIGLPGRPTCDPAVFANGDEGRAHLLARDEIARLTAERDALRAAVERVRLALVSPATDLLDASGTARPSHYDAPLGWGAVNYGPAVCVACGGAYVAYVNGRPSGCKHTPGCAALAQEAALDAFRRRCEPSTLRALLADVPEVAP